MHRTIIRATLLFAMLGVATIAFAQPNGEVLRLAAPFDRASMGWTTATGQRLAEACPKSLAMNPYAQPYDWPEARATVRLDQTANATRVAIHLTGVRPHTRFSAWVRPLGTSPEARELPLSPRHLTAHALTGGRAAGRDVAPVSDDMDGLDNDVWSDAHGNATFKTRLAVPLVDASDSGAGRRAVAALLIASHCADRSGRTSHLGPRQPWFIWTPRSTSSGAE